MTAYNLFRQTGRTTAQLKKLVRNLNQLPKGDILIAGFVYRDAEILLQKLKKMLEKRDGGYIYIGTYHCFTYAGRNFMVTCDSDCEKLRAHQFAYILRDHFLIERELEILYGRPKFKAQTEEDYEIWRAIEINKVYRKREFLESLLVMEVRSIQHTISVGGWETAVHVKKQHLI